MSNLKHLLIETKKHKRRSNFIILIALILLEIFFIYGNFHNEKGVSDGWMILFYNIPVMNTLLMPIFIAVFASRLVDIEHKGDMLKCLYTFSSPEKIYFTKMIYGLIQILIFIPLHYLSIFIMAKVLEFPTDFPSSYMLYYITNTLLSCVMLFLLYFILSYFFKNQAVSISVGIIGCFMGLFAAFLPPSFFQRILPWSTFINSFFVGMDWDKETRDTSWYVTDLNMTSTLITIAWIVLLIVASISLLRKTGIEENAKNNKNRSNSPIRLHKIPTEFLKLKGSPSWYAFFIIPIISAIIGTINYSANIEILTDGWFSLWTQHTLFLSYFFMSVMIAVFCGCIWRVEHNGANMNVLLTHCSPAKIILSKFAASAFITTLSLIWIVLLYIISGKFCGMEGTIPSELPKWIVFGALAAYSICATHIFLSLFIRNFVLPIALGFCGGIVGLACMAKETPYITPYSLFSLAMTENNVNMNIAPFLISAIIYIIVFLSLSIVYLKHTDVKTHE